MFSKLNISKSETLFQFQSHPSYPSALAFSDTLNFMGIKNKAYNLEKEHWNKLPDEFITIYNNSFVLVEKKGNDVILYSDKAKKLPYNELILNAQNFVLIYEKNHFNKSSIKVKGYSYLLYFILFLLIISSLIYNSLIEVIFNFSSILGIFILFEVLKEKKGYTSSIVKNFCNNEYDLINNKNKKTNCDYIFKSNNFNFFGLDFTEFGFIYFIAITFLGIMITHDLTFKILSSLSIIGIIYSIYYQISKKVFCKICSLIIVILITQFCLSLLFPNTIILKESLLALITLTTSFAIYRYINYHQKEKEKFRTESIKNLKFKKNYDLFKDQLLKKNKINFSNHSDLFLIGEPNAKIHLTIITNPKCGFCKEAHELVEKLYKNFSKSISLQFRYNFYPENADDDLIYLISSIKEQYEKGYNDFFESVKYWYKNRNIEDYKNRYKLLNNNSDLSKIISISYENRNKGLIFTPMIFINGYQLPEIYNRDDLYFFIEELIDDNEV